MSTQAEQQQTAFQIDGYFIPRPGESRESAFERAKKELIENLQRSIDRAVSMDHDSWYKLTEVGQWVESIDS